MKSILICSTLILLQFGLFAQDRDGHETLDQLLPTTSRADSSNLSLQINTDCWPEENTWVIENLQGDVIHQGGPYVNQAVSEITESFWLESGVHTFTFYDAAGDGLYATQWGELCDENGSFELVTAAGNVLLEYDGTSNFDSLSVSFDLNSAVSVPDYLSVQSIRTYPNPFTNQLWLDMDLHQSKSIAIEVFSLDGRIQHRLDDKQFSAGRNSVLLHLENLKAGQYLLRITGGAQIETQRIVKLNNP